MTRTVESIAPTASDAERSFSDDVDDFRRKHRHLWQRTDASLPHLGETISTSRQRENAHAADRFTDEMETHFRGFPNDEAGREPWRQDLRRRFRNFGTTMGMPEDQRDVVFSDDFFHVTTDFVRRARSFDRSLEIDRTHCRLLLLHAVAFHEDLYPSSFVRELECHAPFPFAFLRKRRGSVRERSRGVHKTLRRRGIDSIFDVLA